MPSNAPHHSWHGRYSDAASAGSAIVEVAMDHRGIIVSGIPGSSGPVVWPFGALATDTPVAHAAGETILTYKHMPGETLYVDNHDFVVELCTRAPHLTAKAHRWRWARPLIAAALVLVAAGSALWIADVKPARTIASLMPQSAREGFGRQVVKYISKKHAACVAPEGRAALDALFHRLMPEAAASGKFKIIAVNWGLVNAFAAPGGQMVITRGLLTSAQSADEVAGVLAHEIGHGIELHPEAGIVRALGVSALLDLMFGGSSGSLGSLSAILIQSSYGRDDERAADMQALKLLRTSSISQQGLADFFIRIGKKKSLFAPRKSEDDKTGKPDGSPGTGLGSALDVLRSHPRPGERAKYVQATPTYPSRPALRHAEWQALQRICSKLQPL